MYIIRVLLIGRDTHGFNCREAFVSDDGHRDRRTANTAHIILRGNTWCRVSACFYETTRRRTDGQTNEWVFNPILVLQRPTDKQADGRSPAVASAAYGHASPSKCCFHAFISYSRDTPTRLAMFGFPIICFASAGQSLVFALFFRLFLLTLGRYLRGDHRTGDASCSLSFSRLSSPRHANTPPNV